MAQRQCGAVDYVTGGTGTDSWIAMYRTFTDFRGEVKQAMIETKVILAAVNANVVYQQRQLDALRDK